MPMQINISGPIISNSEAWIYDWLGIEAASPNAVNKKLALADGDDVIVNINSEGGYVSSGSEIYTALKSYNGHVTTRIVGLGASAASVIAMGGNKIEMSPTAQMMIHNASVRAIGDHRDMDKASRVLKTIDRSIVNAYAAKTGKDDDELLAMMAEETWMDAKQALDNGFIDAIMFEEEAVKAVASAGATSTMLPAQFVNKLIEGGFKNKLLKPEAVQAPEGFVSKEDVSAMFADFKNDLLSELKQGATNEADTATPEPKEEPKETPKANIFNLFANLK
jgi:ATP-dependent Clp protease, protease subunit